MLKLLDERYASSRAASRIAIQTQLYRKTNNGSDMAKFIDEYCSLFSQLERMGKDAAIPETHKAPMLLAAIPVDSPLEVTAAALRTKDVAELTWEFVTTTLIDETESRSMRTSGTNGATSFRGRRNNKYPKQSNSNLSDNNEFNDVDAAARAFATPWRSKNTDKEPKLMCDYCDKTGHSIEKCFYNPENPNHQLPSKILHRLLVSTNGKVENSDAAVKSKKNRKVEIVGARWIPSL
jgi:gag-polypeptide of LTR copia-type